MAITKDDLRLGGSLYMVNKDGAHRDTGTLK